MKRFLILPLLMLCSLVMAQEQKGVPFNGMIKLLNGDPVKGARIWVVEDLEAKSDKDGKFGLTDVNKGDTLNIRYKKMIYRVGVDNPKGIIIRLGNVGESGESIQALEAPELADQGFGFVKRRESLLPSNGISGEVIRRSGADNVLAALAGRVAGLTVNGDHCYIRGIGTNSDNFDPLYIVDGMKVPSLTSIAVELVDNVEVLKDGSMYGMEGANGVIIVNTLKAKSK